MISAIHGRVNTQLYEKNSRKKTRTKNRFSTEEEKKIFMFVYTIMPDICWHRQQNILCSKFKASAISNEYKTAHCCQSAA